jgi:hypothetical protein
MTTTFLRMLKTSTILAFLSIILIAVFIPQTTIALKVTPITLPGVLTIIETDPQTGEISVQCCPPYDGPCITFYWIHNISYDGLMAQYHGIDIKIIGYETQENPDGSKTVVISPNKN